MFLVLCRNFAEARSAVNVPTALQPRPP